MRTFHQLRGLADRDVDLTVVAPAYRDRVESLRAALDGIDIRLAIRPQSQLREGLAGLARDPGLAAAAAWLPWLGWQARAFWARIAPLVHDVMASGSIDGAIIEHDFAVAWARRLPDSIPAGLVFHNAYWAYYDGLSGLAGAVESRRFRAHVIRQAPRLSHGWAVSEPDRNEIARLLPRLDVDVVPNGVGAGRSAAIRGEPEPGALLFTGSLGYRPNADAVVWFADEVLPKIRAKRSDARLTVVGRGAPRRVLALADDPAITLTGWVDDVAPYQRAAAVVVAPLRSGGGTKLKVLEALAAARPLVATTVAAEGIDVADGVHLLIRDDPQAFADAIVELLNDRERGQVLARAGRKLVAERYDWEVIADAMYRSLRSWLG